MNRDVGSSASLVFELLHVLGDTQDIPMSAFSSDGDVSSRSESSLLSNRRAQVFAVGRIPISTHSINGGEISVDLFSGSNEIGPPTMKIGCIEIAIFPLSTLHSMSNASSSLSSSSDVHGIETVDLPFSKMRTRTIKVFIHSAVDVHGSGMKSKLSKDPDPTIFVYLPSRETAFKYRHSSWNLSSDELESFLLWRTDSMMDER